MTDNKGVLICGEVVEQNITTVTSELISTGRLLSDKLGEPLSLLLIGHNMGEAAREAIFLGADDVYVSDQPLFSDFNPEDHVATVANLCRQISPLLVLFGHTDKGRDSAPRLAAKLDATVCLDCVEVEINLETKKIYQTKPVYGGNAMAVWESTGPLPHIAAMRPRSEEQAAKDAARQGRIIPFSPATDAPAAKVRLLESLTEEVKGIKLEDAKVIVAGGGGIGGKDGFMLIEELARILRGTIGTTRVPSDEGWMPKSIEIGQTGHMVSPDLYIAVGISGAPQHLAGCAGSKRIVAINRDPEANIFREADFGIIGDYKEALPSLIEKLKSILTG
ncbi:MAG: electron transfer flavoprotein subunit alpha/FixB family protein [Candidatus Aminicenantes bacterium]|nr:electron transfer flavoprotein subunit alpha/FixB family protein [Candidatus Aminicenantes bacterium]